MQIKAMFTQLQENQRQMNDAVNSCKSALETEDIGAVSDYALKLCPDFREVKQQLMQLEVSDGVVGGYWSVLGYSCPQ